LSLGLRWLGWRSTSPVATGAKALAAEQRSAEVSLQGDKVLVSGESLDDARLNLFFPVVLGAEATESGWSCPVRRGPGTDLVVRIVRQLQDRGFEVEASGGPADEALQRDIERVRSFARAQKAGREFLGLDGERLATLDEADVLETLEQTGWSSEQRKLLPHQREGVMHALSAANAANFSVPGAGKTATALAVSATHLAHEMVEVVVVVGPLSCFRPWEREAQTALPGVFEVQRIRGLDRLARVELYSRVGAGELLLLSYATAAHDRAELEKLFQRLKGMLIVDESHRVKRFEGGQWAPALVALARQARVRMILTGTPMPQGPKDLWSQFNILWPGEEATGSKGAFRARADADFNSVIGRLEPFYTRTPKSELKLKEADFFEPEIEMAPLQAQIYELIFQQLRASIPDAATWTEKIERLRRARTIRLIQVASNPDLLNKDDGFFNVPPLGYDGGTLMERLELYRHQGELPAKFEWALGYLAELKADNEKCVVWTTFIRNIDQFSALVEDRLGGPVFSVDGRVPAADALDPELSENDDDSGEELDETREQRIDDFLSSEGFAVLIANPAACAESISLHSNCFRAVYLDRTHDCARWLQSIDRIHRLGLPAGVTVEIWIPKAILASAITVDEMVNQALLQKEMRMKALLNDAELRGTGLDEQDSLKAAEGSDADLEALLRYLLGEA